MKKVSKQQQMTLGSMKVLSNNMPKFSPQSTGQNEKKQIKWSIEPHLFRGKEMWHQHFLQLISQQLSHSLHTV